MKMFQPIIFTIIFAVLNARSVYSKIYESYNGNSSISTCRTDSSFPMMFTNITFNEIKSQLKIDKFSSFKCNLGEERCTSWWLEDNWIIGNSISNNMKDILTDRRWQDLKSFPFGTSKGDSLIYTEFMKIEKKPFTVPISIKFENNSNLFFCTNDGVPTSSCYWMEITTHLDGPPNISEQVYPTGHVSFKFRECLENNIPSSVSGFPSGRCANVKEEKKIYHAAGCFNASCTTDWFGLTISNSNTQDFTLNYFFRLPQTFNFDVETHFNINYLFGQSANGGIAKIHNYDFIQTNASGFHSIGRPFLTHDGAVCLTFFVTMCKICRMVFMMAGKELIEISYSAKDTWQPVVVRVRNSDAAYKQMYVKTIGGQFYETRNYWAIDDVQTCQGYDIKLPGTRHCEEVEPRIGPQFKTRGVGTDLNPTHSRDFPQIISVTREEVHFRFPKVKEYDKLTFELDCNNVMKLNTKSLSSRVRPCKLWPNFQCGILDLARADMSDGECYLSLLEMDGAYRRMGRINFNEPPNEPADISITFHENGKNATVTIDHPVVPNGLLTGFKIIYTNANPTQKNLLRSTHEFSTNQSRMFDQKKFSYQIENLRYEPCAKSFLQVAAVNRNGPGFAGTRAVNSPPALPDYFEIEENGQTETTVEFKMKVFDDFRLDINYIYVFISNKDDPSDTKENLTLLGNDFENFTLINFLDLNTQNLTLKRISILFTVGNNVTYSLDQIPGLRKSSKSKNFYLKNEPLKVNNSYLISFFAVSGCNNLLKYYSYNFDIPSVRTRTDGLMIVIYSSISIGIVIILVLIVVLYCYVKRLKKKVMIRIPSRPDTIDNVYFTLNSRNQLGPFKENVEQDKQFLLDSGVVSTSFSPMSAIRKFSSQDDKVLKSRTVRVADFEKYVKSCLENQELENQFSSLVKGMVMPCTVGNLEENKPKNRFNNVLPYDHSRVKLKTLKTTDSDYINANYIKGFKKMYIATQGPKSLTINDFWKMIWQENSRFIIALVNLKEFGVKKVEKYWPDYNEDFQFGNIHVFYDSIEISADYEIRVFKLKCDGEERKIFQYHFLRWPDQGAPVHFQILIPFIKKTLEVSSKSPIVVHCCSGTSNTGVFILTHTTLNVASSSGNVDLLKTANELREQRMNMVDNVLQYKLAHLLVLEILTGIQSNISINEDIDKFLVKLTGPRELELQLKYLEETDWQNRTLALTPVYLEPLIVFQEKNRVQEIIPDSIGIVKLHKYPATQESSAYINAVKVDGYRNPKRYIVTQHPMPNTVNDFWRMIVEKNAEVIVSLNEVNVKEKKSCAFWPTEKHPEMAPVDFILLKYSKSVKKDFFEKIIVHAYVEGNESKKMKVTILVFKGWSIKNALPDDLFSFLKFYQFADSISRQSDKTVITCFNGALASGIYVATSYLIEKIKLEKSFDVCEAVKIMRINRKQFVTEPVQLAFLYEIAVTYVKGYQNYANFSSPCQANFNIYDYVD